MTEMLEGITVLDLASVGPAARASRWLADYGATVVKVGPVPKDTGVQITPPFYAYSAHRRMQRALPVAMRDGRHRVGAHEQAGARERHAMPIASCGGPSATTTPRRPPSDFAWRSRAASVSSSAQPKSRHHT